MVFNTLLNCVIVIIITLHNFGQCSSKAYRNQRLSAVDSVAEPSPIISGGENKINVRNVTFSDKGNILINRRYDKSQNNREFPSSGRHKRNSDTAYLDSNESTAGSATQQLPGCILLQSELYLAWWVNEDGSLKLPASNRNGNATGFVDLSF